MAPHYVPLHMTTTVASHIYAASRSLLPILLSFLIRGLCQLGYQGRSISLLSPCFLSPLSIEFSMEARRATVLLLLLVAFAALQWSPCSAARAPDSLLRLFQGTADSSSSDTCGPQLDIETPTCTVVEKRSTYELRKYTDSEVRFRAAPSSIELPGECNSKHAVVDQFQI